MTDDELWTVTPIPRADVEAAPHFTYDPETGRLWQHFPFAGPIAADRLAALVPDPLRRRTLLDRLCWWRR